MKYKTIIVDLDRTLLQTDKSLSKYTIDTLKKCKEKGMNLIVATGRPLRNTTEYNDILNFDSLVLSNGARIITKDKEIFNEINKNSAKKILNILEKHNIKITIETKETAYSNVKIDNFETIVVNDLTKIIEENEVLKIIIGLEDENTINIIKEYIDENVYYTIAHNVVAQIMSSKATKLKGIEKVFELNNYSFEESIFFGDDNDDIGLIQKCKTGVSMSNAIEKVKKASDVITLSNDEDGVAKFINENVLTGDKDETSFFSNN
jgi:Cof subfamily protein (haloacid dehalogenase superfamily)